MSKNSPEHAKPPQRRAQTLVAKVALSAALATGLAVEATVFGPSTSNGTTENSSSDSPQYKGTQESTRLLLEAERKAEEDTQTLNNGGLVKVKLADGTLVPTFDGKREMPSIIAPIIFYGSVKDGGLIGVQHTAANGENEIKAVEIKPGQFNLMPYGDKQYLNAQLYGTSGKGGLDIYAYDQQSHLTIIGPNGLPLTPGWVIEPVTGPETID